MKKPECYRPNTDPYPLCQGAENSQEFAENDCINCCLYEDMADPTVGNIYDNPELIK